MGSQSISRRRYRRHRRRRRRAQVRKHPSIMHIPNLFMPVPIMPHACTSCHSVYHRCIDIRKCEIVKHFEIEMKRSNEEWNRAQWIFAAYQLRTGSQMERMFFCVRYFIYGSHRNALTRLPRYSGLVYYVCALSRSRTHFCVPFVTINFLVTFRLFEIFFYGKFIVSGSSWRP